MDKEPVPDFSKPDKWHNIRVLVISTPCTRLETRNRPLSGSTQGETAKTALHTTAIHTTSATHAGRHAAVFEAYDLGLSQEHIKHLGRWIIGQFEAFYAPKNPVTGAFYMAHFNKPDEPYFVDRNIHTPPLDLQRAIFPWIEDTFDVDQPGRKETWKKELDVCIFLFLTPQLIYVIFLPADLLIFVQE